MLLTCRRLNLVNSDEFVAHKCFFMHQYSQTHKLLLHWYIFSTNIFFAFHFNDGIHHLYKGFSLGALLLSDTELWPGAQEELADSDHVGYSPRLSRSQFAHATVARQRRCYWKSYSSAITAKFRLNEKCLCSVVAWHRNAEKPNLITRIHLELHTITRPI